MIISINGVERQKETNEPGNHLYQEDLMSVSQNNNKLFLAILIGIFMVSGCSGHAVKYGANSEGEGMGSGGEMGEKWGKWSIYLTGRLRDNCL